MDQIVVTLISAVLAAVLYVFVFRPIIKAVMASLAPAPTDEEKEATRLAREQMLKQRKEHFEREADKAYLMSLKHSHPLREADTSLHEMFRLIDLTNHQELYSVLPDQLNAAIRKSRLAYEASAIRENTTKVENIEDAVKAYEEQNAKINAHLLSRMDGHIIV